MNILVAVNSFKGSLGSAEAGEALAEGLREAGAGLAVTVVPIADGGEGTLQAIVAGGGGRAVTVETVDPLDRPCSGSFVLGKDDTIAIVELAQASGMLRLPREERNPLWTTTRGTGILVRAAIGAGARRILLTVGGSATNDGGIGLSSALGVRFLDKRAQEVAPVGANLEAIDAIDTSAVPPEVRETAFVVATDVQNPLYGPTGAAHVYGPQKGADAAAVEKLDRGLRHLADLIRAKTGVDVANMPGAGAAGGAPACLVGLFGGRIVSGFDMVADVIGLDAKLAEADVVITGEGRLDAQTLHGKVPLGVARRARGRGIPVLAVAGEITREAEALVSEGVVGFFPIVSGPMSLERAMAEVQVLLRTTGRRIGYLLRHFASATK
jgi:glycerate 2-kinase